jgi:methylmalonyl-CoA mutase
MVEKPQLSDFNVPSKAEWEAQLIKELKGAEMNSIDWQHHTLGAIPPYFSRHDQIQPITVPPRSFKTAAAEWEITQTYALHTGSNEQVIRGLADGVSGLGISLNGGEYSREAIERLTAGVYLNMVALRITDGDANTRAKALCDLVDSHPLTCSEWTGCAGADPLLDHLGMEKPVDVDRILLSHVDTIKNTGAPLRSVAIGGNRVFESGGDEALELAVSIHAANHYLQVLLEAGITVDEATNLFDFTLEAGQSYFATIAKFRAMRYLWARVVAEYRPTHACSMVTWIHAVTSLRNYTSNDPHNNLLRGVTAAMGALTGGCDSLEVRPFNPWKTDDQSLRLARNIQHLLKEESWFDATVDPGSGSHYIEFLTHRIIESAMEHLREFDLRGGLITPKGTHYLATTLQKQRGQLLDQVATKSLKVIGVNSYRAEGTNGAFETGPFEPSSVFHPFVIANNVEPEQRGE